MTEKDRKGWNKVNILADQRTGEATCVHRKLNIAWLAELTGRCSLYLMEKNNLLNPVISVILSSGFKHEEYFFGASFEFVLKYSVNQC